MKLEEIRSHTVLKFDESHGCLCGCRVVLDDAGDCEDDLYVVCEDGTYHSLIELCDDDGHLAGVSIESDLPSYAMLGMPPLDRMQQEVDGLLGDLDLQEDNAELVATYLLEAIIALTMVRYLTPKHEHPAVVEDVIGMAYELSTPDQIH